MSVCDQGIGSAVTSRRAFLAAAGLGAGLGMLGAAPPSQAGKGAAAMKAGFAREKITPPAGTVMMGFGARDMARGCEGTHDDIYVSALYLEHGGERALVMGYDLCFLGREEADRFKGAIGRKLDLLPRQILLNTSHNHVGPAVGTWYSAGYECPDRLYLNDLERATLGAACGAQASMREVTMHAGVTRTALPMNRRRKMDNGQIENRPNPKGLVYDKLPLCLFKDKDGAPVCLIFSISTHPSMMSGWQISGEYPGAAMRLIDKRLGTPCALFLQGVGGDSKPSVIGRGSDRWQPGTWELMEEAGAMVADEVAAALDDGLQQIEPSLCTASVEMEWPLQPAPPRSEFEEAAAQTKPEDRENNIQHLWAINQLERLDRGDTLPTSVTLTAHGVRLGKGLRILGIEGEAVGEWGHIIDKYYGAGVTFPLGYTDGTGLYLPTSKMLPEGSYEVVSYWEYGYPAPFAPGMEDVVLTALRTLREAGIN